MSFPHLPALYSFRAVSGRKHQLCPSSFGLLRKKWKKKWWCCVWCSSWVVGALYRPSSVFLCHYPSFNFVDCVLFFFFFWLRNSLLNFEINASKYWQNIFGKDFFDFFFHFVHSVCLFRLPSSIYFCRAIKTTTRRQPVSTLPFASCISTSVRGHSLFVFNRLFVNLSSLFQLCSSNTVPVSLLSLPFLPPIEITDCECLHEQKHRIHLKEEQEEKDEEEDDDGDGDDDQVWKECDNFFCWSRSDHVLSYPFADESLSILGNFENAGHAVENGERVHSSPTSLIETHAIWRLAASNERKAQQETNGRKRPNS